MMVTFLVVFMQWPVYDLVFLMITFGEYSGDKRRCDNRKYVHSSAKSDTTVLNSGVVVGS